MFDWLRRLLERIDSWFDVDLGHLDDEPVRAALSQLDGSDRAAVSLLTGLTAAELDDLGGMG